LIQKPVIQWDYQNERGGDSNAPLILLIDSIIILYNYLRKIFIRKLSRVIEIA
jgi:hypothetical protein